jgi:type VI secretion system protein ImpJ
MSDKNKVVWSEGMFLRPQHLQQQERYFETYIKRCVAASGGYFWGFGALEVDEEALGMGTILVRRAQGLLPDGTPFDLVADDVPLLAFDFPPEARDVRVCLVLPPLRAGEESVIYDEDVTSAARFTALAREVGDANKFGAGAAEIQVGRPRFRLLLENAVPNGWVSMGMVRVIERQASEALRMDRSYIPPTLNCGAQESLSGFIHEVSGLLNQRAEALAGRLVSGGRGGVSNENELLTLALINRWLPRLTHLEQVKMLHPERLYADLVSLAGELATFSTTSRRPVQYPVYRHDDLQASFLPLLIDLRRNLTLVLEQTFLRIELQDRRYGVKAAIVPDRALLQQASFILAVHANMPAEQILAQFPAQTKVGPVEKIRDMMTLHLPGIALRPLPVAPRELPYHAGYSYFEVDTQHELWKALEKSAGVALHVAGNFPDLDLECWAIRKEV